MNGIDILTALNNIDDELLLDAHRVKRTSPRWLKTLSIAAIFCCLLISGGITLHQITDSVVPSVSHNQPPLPSENADGEESILLYSSTYDLELPVPAQYADDFTIDTPYLPSEQQNSDPLSPNPTAFTFLDSQQQEGQSQYIWSICVYDKEDYDSEQPQSNENTPSLKKTVIARDNQQVYELQYPDITAYQVGDFHQEAYSEKALDGYEILLDFIQQNGLTPQEDGLASYYALITESSVSSPSISQSVSADITHCNHNLYTADGAYWILTDAGLEQLELTNLHTTVDLYGTWELDLDYAIVDGNLVFQNNVRTESYAIYNGEILTASEYHDGGMSAVYGQLEWMNPAVAYAIPIENSSDTVLLQIYREDISSEERCAYTFLYNIFTGEIQDPLANIPALFDHGSFCNATYNDSFTYAIVKTLENGTMHSYICDLNQGTMTSLLDIASGCIPDFDNPNSVSDVQSSCYWSGENNLLFYIVEQIPNEIEGSHLDNGAYNTDFDYCYYLTSYNLSTNTLNYQVNLGQVEPVDNDLSGVYLHFWNTERNLFRFINTETGLLYDFNIDLTEYSMYTGEAIVLFWNNTDFYLLDEASPGWAILSDNLVPRTSDTWVRLLTDAWLLLTEDKQAELIQIQEELSLTLLSSAEP